MKLEKVEHDFRFTAKTCEIIAQENGTYRKKIEKLAKDNGWIRAYKDKDWLEKQYFGGGKTIKDIAEFLNCNASHLAVTFKKLGIKIDREKQYKRKHEYNNCFFETIDTEEKAYWLGFIMADGCISSSNGRSLRLDIHLSIQDKEHLMRFAKTISKSKISLYYADSNDTIEGRKINSKESVNLRLNSTKICRDLMNLGVRPRKTGNETFPDIEKGFYRHFIRGFVDGDGSLGMYDNTKCDTKYSTISISSSFSIIESIQKIIQDELQMNLTINKHSQHDCLNTLISTNRPGMKIMNWLYKDSSIYLERKFKIYQECSNYYSLKDIV